MVIVPMGKFLFAFLEKGKILKGERGKPIYWCMLFELTLFFLSQFSFFSSLFSFLSFFFSFPLALFFFSRCEMYSLFFHRFYRARQGPLYSAYRDQCFTVLPLNRLCLVWVYLPTILCDTKPCQTEADSFCPTVRRGLSCHDVNLFSPHTQSMHSTVPSQIASFRWSIIPAGRTSQKRLEQGP